MDAHGSEEDLAVTAAKILLSLRNRKLLRWPEWVHRPSDDPADDDDAAVVVLQPLEIWPKRRRSPPRALAKDKSKAHAWGLTAPNLGSPLEYGIGAASGSSSSWEDVPGSPPRAEEKPKLKVEMLAARMADTPLYYGVAAGSGPTTSGIDREASQPRHQPRSSEKVEAAKVVMAAPSPETPLEYAAAARSGASSSGEEGARSPSKRKAPGAGGSEGASSDHEGCSSPSKRTREDSAAGDGEGQAKVEEPKIQRRSSPNRDENGVLLFDLNDDVNIPWEG